MKSDCRDALSRRDFLAKSGLGAGGMAAAGTAAIGAVGQSSSNGEAGLNWSIRIPADLPQSPATQGESKIIVRALAVIGSA